MGNNAQYLVVIYALERAIGSPIPTGRIAERLDRSPSATTEMVQRLERTGLVEHESYAGVRLTDAGREHAAELHETYEILCRFFREVLDVDEYETVALELVGVIDPSVAHRLQATLLTHEPTS